MKCKLLNTYKLKKLFKKGLTPLLCALTVFNYCCINAFAYEFNVNVPFIEPAIPEYGGYVNIYGDYGYGDAITTYVIQFFPYAWDAELNASGSNDLLYQFYSVAVECTDTSFTTYVSINENYPGMQLGGMVVVYRLASDGEVVVVANQYVDEDDPFIHTRNYVNVRCWQPVGNFSTIYSRLTEYNSMKVLWGDDTRQFNMLSTISNRLQTIADKVDITNVALTTTNSRLQSILNNLDELLNNSSEGSISDVSSSGITSVENKENALVGNNASTTDLNVNINPLASSVVWNLVDNVVTGNAKVFTMFISILTIAVIGLILNR